MLYGNICKPSSSITNALKIEPKFTLMTTVKFATINTNFFALFFGQFLQPNKQTINASGAFVEPHFALGREFSRYGLTF